MKNQLIALAASLLSLNAFAADPTASIDRSWVEYTGAGTVGNNNVNDNKNMYWMYESSGTWLGQAVHSWFVFWDPKKASAASGSIGFDNKILFVQDSQAGLQATAGFGKAGVAYDYSHRFVGLEALDAKNTSFSGNTLSFKWNASNPGDHIRVMTAVPEPGTYAMFGAGLLALCFMARRSRAG